MQADKREVGPGPGNEFSEPPVPAESSHEFPKRKSADQANRRARALSEEEMHMQTEDRSDDGGTADGERDGCEGGTDDGEREGGGESRAMDMLRELVREEGRMEAAEMLGVNYKTLARALGSGMMSRRMGEAVERLLVPGEDGTSGRSRMRDRISALERRMEAVDEELGGTAEEVGRALDRAHKTAGTDLRRLRDEHGRALRALTGRVARLEAAPARAVDSATAGGGNGGDPDPLVVTEEPGEEDERTYGAAWLLVAEWRLLRAEHPGAGRSLSWLETEERVLTLELALLEEHGLTLPPEKEPLRGFGRAGQVNWRRAALADARRAIARRRWLRWVPSLRPWRGRALRVLSTFRAVSGNV